VLADRLLVAIRTNKLNVLVLYVHWCREVESASGYRSRHLMSDRRACHHWRVLFSSGSGSLAPPSGAVRCYYSSTLRKGRFLKRRYLLLTDDCPNNKQCWPWSVLIIGQCGGSRLKSSWFLMPTSDPLLLHLQLMPAINPSKLSSLSVCHALAHNKINLKQKMF